MKFFGSLLAVAAIVSGVVDAAPTFSYLSGFNIGHSRPDGSCKTANDFVNELRMIENDWNNGNTGKQRFNAVKIFSTGDCNALANIVQAIKSSGSKMKVYAGVWNVPEWKFEQDKSALEQAIRTHGASWLAGVYVGSESLYRKEITASRLTEQIYDVKGMVQNKDGLNQPQVPIGTADTWTSWVDGANAPVIKAVDIALMNAFPYWQGVDISGGLDKLKEAIANTRRAVGWNKPFLIGETGWPSGGPNFGASAATRANTQRYWKEVVCWLQQRPEYPWFWFSAFDEPQRESEVERNFGISDVNKKPKVGMNINKLCGL